MPKQVLLVHSITFEHRGCCELDGARESFVAESRNGAYVHPDVRCATSGAQLVEAHRSVT